MGDKLEKPGKLLRIYKKFIKKETVKMTGRKDLVGFFPEHPEWGLFYYLDSKLDD